MLSNTPQTRFNSLLPATPPILALLLIFVSVHTLLLSPCAAFAAGEFTGSLRYDFSLQPAAYWYTISSDRLVYSESPAFTVTGDSLSVEINVSDCEIVASLCRLDGSIVREGHAPSESGAGGLHWSISEYIGETLYLAVRVNYDAVTGIASISIDGVENEYINEHQNAYRAARNMLIGTDASALMAAQEAMRTIPGVNSNNIPRFDPDAFTLQVSLVRSMLSNADPGNFDAMMAAADSLMTLKRRILLANPLLADTTILYRTNTSSGMDAGNVMKRLVLNNDKPTAETVINRKGVIENFDIDYDGEHVIFSMRPERDGHSHLYEYDTSNQTLTQLTSAEGVSDIGPSYLPDGTVVFSSTRSMRYDSETGAVLTSLYRMERDGTNIYRIGGSPFSESGTSVLPDGRILYSRHAAPDVTTTGGEGLFAVSPDGTAHSLFWNGGNGYTGGISDAHALPLSGELLAVLDDSGTCSLALIDRRKGMEARSSIVRTWPASDESILSTHIPATYSDPYPLNENFYLCSRSTGNDTTAAIWLIDRFGNELQVYADPDGCRNPQLLKVHDRPPVIPPRRKFTGENGMMYVLSVYDSPHLENVDDGKIAYLRIVESLPKHTGSTLPPPAVGIRDNTVRRVLGTVPIEQDGSAFISLPAERSVSFQLLDRDGMLIQSMQSSTMVQPGETTGCMGCHDNRTSSPAVAIEKVPHALLHDPAVLPASTDDTGFDYYSEIQTIFNKSCISCHDYGGTAENALNLAPDRTPAFNISYVELWHNNLTGWEPDSISFRDVPAPYSRGSSASGLVTTLRGGHHDITLTDDDLSSISTWIDLGAPYYGTYNTAYPNNPMGRSPLDSLQIDSLAFLTGISSTRLSGVNSDNRPLISFARPEFSRCLSSFENDTESEKYRDALSIITEGKMHLAEHPRADMPGFQLSESDILDARRAEHGAERESVNRAAILNGIRRYDDNTQLDK